MSAISATLSLIHYLASLIIMPISAQATQNVKNILDGVTSDPSTGVPGLVLTSVDKTGKSLVEHPSGTRGAATKEPMTPDTVFWIASCTKLITLCMYAVC